MKRADQLAAFKKIYPNVDVHTVTGALLFQGFMAGYNTAWDAREKRERAYRRELEEIKAQ